jgi:hypothetical protein
MVAGPEIELKFLFAGRDVAKVKALVAAVPSAQQAADQRLRTIYQKYPPRGSHQQTFHSPRN